MALTASELNLVGSAEPDGSTHASSSSPPPALLPSFYIKRFVPQGEQYWRARKSVPYLKFDRDLTFWSPECRSSRRCIRPANVWCRTRILTCARLTQVKNDAYFSRFQVKYRRRREGKTDCKFR